MLAAALSFCAALAWAGAAPAVLPAVIDFFSGEEDIILYGEDGSDSTGQGGSRGEKGSLLADVNGDGAEDLIVLGYDADGPLNGRVNCGEIYIYYGPLAAGVLDVANTAGSSPDVVIYGRRGGDSLGRDGAMTTGDVNGDGTADIIAAASGADGVGNLRTQSGEIYVIYGGAFLPATIDIALGDQDVTIYGASASDYLGAMGGLLAADVNGDGVDDILAAAYQADGPADAKSAAGEVYVVCGGAALPAAIDINAGDQDLTIYGTTAGDNLGYAFGLAAGDVNGDGINDIIVGGNNADGPLEGRINAGEVYVVFGTASPSGAVDLANQEEDVTIYGATSGDRLGLASPIGLGDVNGDGVSDMVIGAYNGDGPSNARSG